MNDARCYVHPDGRGYRDPATDVWRCIECEGDPRCESILLDWRDYFESSNENIEAERFRKRMAMRKITAARKVQRQAIAAGA